jgi:nicotinamide-nucleotide amidase
MENMTNPTLAPYAKDGEVMLRVTAAAPTAQQAEEMMVPVVEKLQQNFADLIYGVDVGDLQTAAVKALQQKGLTVATAESCTGGLIAKRMTDLPGVSQVFKGGTVSYTNEVKSNILGVPAELLEQYGAVSAPVAQAMAEGARKVLNCDLAISSTGVAGPDKDDRGNEVGTMFVAIATPEGTYVRPLTLGTRPMRQRLRTQTAHHAFDLARRYLSKLPYEG